MKLKKANINKVIRAITNAHAANVRMTGFIAAAGDAPCGTAGCIAGWCMAQARAKTLPEMHNLDTELRHADYERGAAEFLGLNLDVYDESVVNALFYMKGLGDDYADFLRGVVCNRRDWDPLHLFDELPAEVRRLAVVYVLARLRDRGKVEWRPAVEWALEEHRNAKATFDLTIQGSLKAIAGK